MATPTAIVPYLALFFAVGFLFLLINLVVGWFLRPKNPNQEKLEIYECGEPTIGSSFVQFDLRFYVVALLFLIFDVEVAFFFPWANVYGKATNLLDPTLVVAPTALSPDQTWSVTPAVERIYNDLGAPLPAAGDRGQSGRGCRYRHRPHRRHRRCWR